MYLLYSLGLDIAFLLTLPYWLWQMARTGKYRAGLSERLGRIPSRLRLPDARGAIWIHAVSVGEVLAVVPVVTELRKHHRVFISTTTLTGQTLSRERFGAENVFYVPLDFAFAIGPWLRALQPELLILAETEFWPNLLRLARASGARVAVINARISDRSFPRYRSVHSLLRRVLANVDTFLTQSVEDASRLRAIGAVADRVHVAGNLKFDAQPPAATTLVAQLKTALPPATVIVCGSTMPGEDEAVLSAFGASGDVLHPSTHRVPQPSASAEAGMLILAPRHPQRFGEVAELVTRLGLPLVRRSAWQGEQIAAGSVFLLDSVGELAAVYELATVAVVGGSFANFGGHNVVEPARHGRAIIVGPHTQNFRDVIIQFRRANAIVETDFENLFLTIGRLLHDDAERAALGARARAVVRANAGATARTVAALQRLLEPERVTQPNGVPHASVLS